MTPPPVGGAVLFPSHLRAIFHFHFRRSERREFFQEAERFGLIGLLVCNPDKRITWYELKRINGPKELSVSQRLPFIGWFPGTWSATYILLNPHKHLTKRNRWW